ncbi:MAG: sugar phosphate isomerase/epimerase [Alphaproteobacteria bacterium]|nr:sugar phosphate isomerase/epimerase [Alphaproteobacteria bacterium]
MQRLLVLQSLWAMERRRPDGQEWSLEEKIAMIADAGFDGASVDFGDAACSRRATALLRERGLTWQVECFVATVAGLRPIVELHRELGGTHINLLPTIRPYTLDEAVPFVEGWRDMARAAGVDLLIETHRNVLTTDLIFTLHLLDRFPDLRLEADLSHFLVGREFGYPVSDENQAHVHRILDASWAIQGRVGSREQIQVPITFPHLGHWLDLFLGWWEYGIRSWHRRAGPDATLTFLCELGPKEYAITGADGYELSDRWQEALILKDLIRELWRRIAAEGR